MSTKSKTKPKKALGKGLSALISEGDEAKEEQKTEPQIRTVRAQPEENDSNDITAVMVSVDNLQPGSFQPRGYFDEEQLKELSESIKENSVLQPILVRYVGDSKVLQIIAGERRWRAAKMAGLDKIPAIIKTLSDKEALEAALIENIQRASLTPIEEAEGYKKLQEKFDYTQERLSSNMGKSRSHIANMLRLLQLPDEIKEMINSGQLTMGHARALINSDNPIETANEIIKKGLSVRQAEKFAAGSGKVGGGKNAAPIKRKSSKASSDNLSQEDKDEDLIVLENSLSESMGLRVTVDDCEEGGRVTLYFNNLSELDKILQRIG